MTSEENNKFHPDIIQAALDFSRVIMQHGDSMSYERITSILTAYDADLPGEIMMVLLRNDFTSSISIKLDKHQTSKWKIDAIKAIRTLTSLGLKEAKDITDEADWEKTVKIPGKFTTEQRNSFVNALKGTGYMVV